MRPVALNPPPQVARKPVHSKSILHPPHNKNPHLHVKNRLVESLHLRMAPQTRQSMRENDICPHGR